MIEGSPTEGSAPKPRVLVMDDEAVLRRLVQAILRHAGHEVEAVGDGAEAVKRYSDAREEGRPFDVVILDLSVPGGVDGKETLKQLRALDPKVRAMFSTGHPPDVLAADPASLGVSRVLLKPYRPEELVEAVAAMLRKR